MKTNPPSETKIYPVDLPPLQQTPGTRHRASRFTQEVARSRTSLRAPRLGHRAKRSTQKFQAVVVGPRIIKKVPGRSSLAAGTAGLRRPNIADRVSTRTVQGPGRKHRYRHTVLKMRPPCGPVFATIFWSRKRHEKRTPTVGVFFSCRFLDRNLRSKK